MTQLLQNAAYGSALILAVAILRRVLKERLLPEARLALWAVCLFRLLTPAAPESVLSLWGLPKLFAPEKQAAPTPSVAGYVPAMGTPAPAPQATPDPAISWETVLVALWLAVGAVLAVRYLLSWTRTRRAVNCAILLDRNQPQYSLLPKCARLREGSMEGAPLTFGAMRPTVVLSPGLDGTELDCVLAHEGVHARRRDNLWHYAMALTLVVHWWNPAVWLMSRLLRRDIELSCDRAAVRALGEDRRTEYAQALVSLATQADGPAFCHTFGRKAAEERILSIMKFKKTSIIGVIFSLALVLALTAAFASEPKTIDDTVVYHGRTYSRAELSQGTLDWLDWYLTLSEEEQMAISFEPSELRGTYNGSDVNADDAFSSVKGDSKTPDYFVFGVPVPEKTKDIQSDYPTVNPDDVDLSLLKERLAQKVADGIMTQEAADERLAGTERMLEQARRGELKLFFDDKGDLYGGGVFVINGTEETYYTGFGDPPSTDNGGEIITGYDTVELVMLSLEGFQNGLAQRVKDGRLTQAEADQRVEFLLNLMDLENLSDIKIPEDGGFVISVNPEDFTVGGYAFGPHPESFVEFVEDSDGADQDATPLLGEWNIIYDGQRVDSGSNPPAPAPSAAPAPVAAQPVVNTSPVVICAYGVEGCTETRYHMHSGGSCVLLSEPCPVNGCTMTGNHYHGNVCYSCNGAGHSGGHCDGSCYTYSQPNTTTTTTSGHHSESHSSGHHGNGHH